MIQSCIFYSGTVQGVGFRYAVQRFAQALTLKGWVRNLSDGRVEILVEGKKEVIAELLRRIDQRFDGYIRDKQVSESEALENFASFEIDG